MIPHGLRQKCVPWALSDFYDRLSHGGSSRISSKLKLYAGVVPLLFITKSCPLRMESCRGNVLSTEGGPCDTFSC